MEHNFLLQIYHDGLLHVLENEIFYSCNMNKLKNTKDKKKKKQYLNLKKKYLRDNFPKMPHKFACKKGLPSATINKTSVNLMMSCTIGDNPVGLSPESITKSLIHQVSFDVSCHSRSLKSSVFF